MLRIKKIGRAFLFVILIVLALTGIGIPPPKNFFEKKEDTIELVENEEESDKD